MISQGYQTKQEEKKSLTIASFSLVGQNGDQSIQIIKQSTEKQAGRSDPSLIMEITTLDHPYLALEDIIVNRDTILNLEKRTSGKHRQAYPLFNHQFTAISDSETNKISIYPVVKDVQDDS